MGVFSVHRFRIRYTCLFYCTVCGNCWITNYFSICPFCGSSDIRYVALHILHCLKKKDYSKFGIIGYKRIGKHRGEIKV